MSLDTGLLLASAKERGELETRITSLIEETRSAGACCNVCVFMFSILRFSIIGRHLDFVSKRLGQCRENSNSTVSHVKPIDNFIVRVHKCRKCNLAN